MILHTLVRDIRIGFLDLCLTYIEGLKISLKYQHLAVDQPLLALVHSPGDYVALSALQDNSVTALGRDDSLLSLVKAKLPFSLGFWET